MTLLLQIEGQIKEAMVNKETLRLSALRVLKSAIQYAAIEKGGADYKADDALVISVVRKEVKKRQDSIDGFQKAGRADLIEKEKAEIDILTAFLPQEMSDADLEKLVRDAIAESGATGKAQMGAVMKIAQAKAAGRADGKRLSQLVGKLLA
jgi:uncharacterized protein YqeY